MSKSKPTVGYRYYMGLHMGICRGPVDEVMEIRVGDRSAWKGRQRPEFWTLASTGWARAPMVGVRMIADDSYAVTSSQAVQIAAPNLFGGAPSGEGGVAGSLKVMMGESTQTAPAGLAAMLGGVVPGFRGFVSLFFDGMVGAMNPYPKAWKFRVRRTNAGWDGPVWYPAKEVVWLGTGQGHDGIRAMNPAHLIYELYTNKDFGRGLPASRLDLVSFQAAADQLYTEGFGLCLAWARQTSVAEFLQIVLDHIGAACAPDLSTGLIRLKLIRDDYVAADLPTFGYDSGLLAIDEEESSSTDSVANDITVKWFDPVRKQQRQTPPVQNLGSIQAVGCKSTTTDYPGLPTADLAMRVAQRDLRASSRALRRFRVRLDRRAYAIQPGDAFRINVPVRGLDNLVVRAGRIEEAAITDGTITITCVQDVFGLPSAPMVVEQEPLPAPDYNVPPAITASRLLEVPYVVLAQSLTPAELAAVDATSCYVGTLAAAPASFANDYLIYSRPGSAAYTYKQDNGDWVATALAGGGVAATGEPVEVSLTSADRLDSVVVGSPVLWDDEILRVEAIDATALTATLARGCADTVPAAHASGSRLWFMGADLARDSTECLPGEVVSVKLLAQTPENFADPDDVTAGTITMAQRQYRPYPPGNLKFNGVAYPALDGGDLTITWAHRNRITQADQLADTTAASITPEAGTTYTLRIYGGGDDLLRTITGITGTSQTYTTSDETADTGGVDSVDPLWSSVSFLLLAQGANNSTAFTDSGPIGHAITVSGNTKVVNPAPSGGPATSTAVFDGTDDYLSLPNHASLNNFGTGDFAIDAWVWFNNVDAEQTIIDCTSSWAGVHAYLFEIRTGGDLRFYAGNGVPISIIGGSGSVAANTWHWVEVSRVSGNTRMFVDGVQKGSTHSGSVTISNSSAPRIGTFYDGAIDLNGYIAALRITKGAGRNSANYTPPTGLPPAGTVTAPNTALRFELESVRDGLTSLQMHDVTVHRTP